MERLTSRDLRAVQQFIRAIYEEAGRSDSADSWFAGVAAHLERFIPNSFITYRENIRSDARSCPRVLPRSIDTPATREQWPKVADDHPLIQHFVRNPTAGTARMSEVVERARLHRLPLYNEFYRALHVEDVLALQFTTRDSIEMGIGLHRERAFSARERNLLDAIRPYLAQAYDNVVAAAELRRQIRVLDCSLEGAERGVISLRRDRRIGFATERARAWLEEYFGARGEPNRLPELLNIWVVQHDAALHGILEIAGPPKPLVVQRRGKQLILRIVSVDDEYVIQLEERRTAIEPWMLAGLGLTSRETQVLTQIVHGRSNKQAAADLGISPRTVQVHLEHIYRRLGVETRAAASAQAVFAASRDGAGPHALSNGIAEIREARGYISSRFINR